MTLVEVLTVIFIVGLASGLVVLTLPDRPDAAEKRVDRFALDVKQVADRAILTGQVQGIAFSDDGYTLVQWDGDTWSDRRSRKTGEDNLELRVLRREDDRGDTRPDLIFDPTGVNDPVDLEMTVNAKRFRLLIDANGDVLRDAG